MKLSNAFDGLARENQFLKALVKLLVIVTIAAIGLAFITYDKMPLIVERSSRGLEITSATEFARTQLDVKQATALMLHARFDTDAVSPEILLNPKQLALRSAEQIDMKARGMSQSIVIRRVLIEKDRVLVDLDRVISVGEIRSALRARLKVSFEETSPNELNPYGLQLSVAEPIEQKE
jgi:hypothetical protein